MDPPEFSPAIVLPPFDVEKRVNEPQEMLKSGAEGQNQNIELVIEMYRKGDLPKGLGYLTIVQDGKVTTVDGVHGNSPWWRGGTIHRFILASVLILFHRHTVTAIPV
ncbi:hypothetical protein F5884DRAFT_850250 [Xylogone sp. PMI_703]|nr:hypothetical protein F5884DRAFT_850250 [Xylogone sp. PMI_703]